MEAALSMDRTKLEGRPMFISPSVDKSTNPTQFKVEYYWHLLIVTDICYLFIFFLLSSCLNKGFDWLIYWLFQMWPMYFFFVVSHITEQENIVCL